MGWKSGTPRHLSETTAARRIVRLLLVGVPFVLSGCVLPLLPVNVKSDRVTAVTPGPDGLGAPRVDRPAKVHLDDGSVVLFPNGYALENGMLRGTAEQYDLRRAAKTPVEAVPAARVVLVQIYDRKNDMTSSIGASLAINAAIWIVVFVPLVLGFR